MRSHFSHTPSGSFNGLTPTLKVSTESFAPKCLAPNALQKFRDWEDGFTAFERRQRCFGCSITVCLRLVPQFVKIRTYGVCPESIGPTFISPRRRYSSSSGEWHPSKQSPLDWITRFQRCFHFSKQSWKSLLGMALRTLVALFSTVVLSSNRCPLRRFLSFGNS